MPQFQEIGGRRGGGGAGEGEWGLLVNVLKLRNIIYSRLALTEGKITLHRAFCSREGADSSPVPSPVFGMCQLTRDTVFVCSQHDSVVFVSTF